MTCQTAYILWLLLQISKSIQTVCRFYIHHSATQQIHSKSYILPNIYAKARDAMIIQQTERISPEMVYTCFPLFSLKYNKSHEDYI